MRCLWKARHWACGVGFCVLFELASPRGQRTCDFFNKTLRNQFFLLILFFHGISWLLLTSIPSSWIILLILQDVGQASPPPRRLLCRPCPHGSQIGFFPELTALLCWNRVLWVCFPTGLWAPWRQVYVLDILVHYHGHIKIYWTYSVESNSF